MKENMDALLQLKGTQEEREWLRENLESLSVREGTILAAALEWHPPDSMMSSTMCCRWRNMRFVTRQEIMSSSARSACGRTVFPKNYGNL